MLLSPTERNLSEHEHFLNVLFYSPPRFDPVRRPHQTEVRLVSFSHDLFIPSSLQIFNFFFFCVSKTGLKPVKQTSSF